MAHWYIKEFGELTGVSVRTLHHYDAIGLLKPRVRQETGYRLYTPEDVVTLQQILALKQFGFSLAQIKQVLSEKTTPRDHLLQQARYVQEQINTLQKTHDCLKQVLADTPEGASIELDNVLTIIRNFTMMEKLKKSWAGKHLPEELLEQWAELASQHSPEFFKEYQDRWTNLIARVEKSLDKDPHSPEAQALAHEWMNLLNEVYGNSPDIKAGLRDAYTTGKIENPPYSKEVWEWIVKANKYQS